MNYFKLGLVITYSSWFLAWILIVVKLDWFFFLIFLLFGLGLSGIIIWVIMIPELNKLERKIKNLKNKK